MQFAAAAAAAAHPEQPYVPPNTEYNPPILVADNTTHVPEQTKTEPVRKRNPCKITNPETGEIINFSDLAAPNSASSSLAPATDASVSDTRLF